jgi:hypothetical protein
MHTRPRTWLPAVLALALAALFAGASLGNILLPQAYAREAPSWAAQGLGQDWVDLLVVVPALVVLSCLALRGSRRSALLLGGTVAYTLYSLVLYAFAVHFNPLFLVYAIGLGVSFYAMVTIVVVFAGEDVASWFSPRTPTRIGGAFSVLIGGAFYLLWLSEIVPALLAGATPGSLADVGLITNPVQVLDIGIVLPAFIVGGIALVRQKALGYWLVPVMLTLGLVMDLALIGMDISMAILNVPGGGRRVPLFTVMAGLTLAVLWALLRNLRSRPSA